MKLNIFRIPKENVAGLRSKLNNLKLKDINSASYGNWQTNFYFSENVDPIKIPWVETYADFFLEGRPTNKIYFCIYLWENEKYCFAFSYGKSHFYLRPFCDPDFGTEIAKRIADQKDTRQKSSKKFAGRKKKEIKSYTKNSKLDIESGESIDYLQSAIIETQKVTFGKTGKFGSSVLLNPEMEKGQIPEFLNSISKIYESTELFKLPRTMMISDPAIILPFEQRLIDEIVKSKGGSDFVSDSHELIGIDFVFSGQEKYNFSFNGNESEDLNELSMEALNDFISEFSVPKDQILDIRISIAREDQKPFSRSLKQSLDYIIDTENVILSQGKRMRFNEDYVDQLNEYIDDIEVEETEDGLSETKLAEPDFNKSLKEHGYIDADKNFEIIKIASGTPIEAWDSKKGNTVYAIKFGTPQKLGYVCDQANNTLELISKKANIKKLSPDFKNYCVWFVMKRENLPKKISEINSIIFKQKIESWARKSGELGINPKIKISRLVK